MSNVVEVVYVPPAIVAIRKSFAVAYRVPVKQPEAIADLVKKLDKTA